MSDLHHFFVHVACGHGSVLYSGGVAMYSGFMDDVVMTGICEKRYILKVTHQGQHRTGCGIL